MTDLTSSPSRQIGAVRPRPVYRVAKRALDVLAAGVGLVLLAPVLLLAAIAIKLDSRGPVLFLQTRMGRNFVPFRICKFRTMVVDAEQRGAQITSGVDPRVTRVGGWLRKTKIDELPQLLNVLRGDMSLVGPRPEVPRYVELLHDDYVDVLSVRPGLTDPSSIKYRNEAEILAKAADPEREYVERILPDKLAVSRAYLARATLVSDLGVLLATALRIAR